MYYNNRARFFIVLFCFSKKEPKKEPANRAVIDWRNQLCAPVVLL